MFIIAHRGMGKGAGENTLASVKKAIDLGARFVKFGVWSGSLKGPVLSHDKPLSNCGLTRLTEVLGLICQSGGVTAVIEVKDFNAVADTLFLIKEYNLVERSIVFSFDLNILREAQRIVKIQKLGIARGFLYEKKAGKPAPKDPIADARSVGAKWIAPCYTLITEELVKAAHGVNLLVGAWIIDDIKVIKEMDYMFHVDAAVTNNPAYFSRV